MAENKITGLGTVVWAKANTSASPCDLDITSIQAPFELFGCAYSVRPPGTSWTTVEEEQCLDGANQGAVTWATGQIYPAGTIVKDSSGNLWVVTGNTGSPTAGTDADLGGGSDTSGHTYVAYTSQFAADPAARLGRKEADEIEIVRNFSPGGPQTEKLRSWSKTAQSVQFALQYPPQQIQQTAGPPPTFAEKIVYDTFCGFIRSSVPDPIEPETFMRATFSILRDGDWKQFQV